MGQREITVDVKDMDIFKDVIYTIADMMSEDEIPDHIKERYMETFNQILEG